MSDQILGKVKFDTLDTLFQMGYLPHPNDLIGQLDEIVSVIWEFGENTYNKKVDTHESEVSWLGKLLNNAPKPVKNAPSWKPSVQQASIMKPYDEHIRKLYLAVEDIKVVLETLDTAKHSQSSFVLAGRYKLKTLEKVANNKEYYLYLDDIVSKQLEVVKEKFKV